MRCEMILRGLFPVLMICFNSVQALDVKLTQDKEFVEVIHGDKLVRIQRIQDQDHMLEGSFAKTSRKCPPFCIQPMSAGEGVRTVGQVEIFSFMESELLDGTGVIVDSRTPSWWKRGTIPGSINIPFTTFTLEVNDPQLIEVMKSLGAKRRGEVSGFSRAIEQIGLMGGSQKNDEWDFTNAKNVLLWCNGMWCGQSPRAIRGLLELGYPADKILYYRGGMQAWQSLGLTTIVPDN